MYCGAKVDFVDIDSRTYNMDAGALERKLTDAKRVGKLPKIVVPVHFAGQSCDMRAIRALADQFGFCIVEDASHAVGASYLGQPVGSCRHSDITVFSFHPVKIITTAEGGMAVTNDASLAKRMQVLRSHGITRDDNDMEGPSAGAWYYQQIELGYNYRMTELQAALGLSQFSRLDAYVQRRQEIAKVYDAQLADLPLTTPWQSPDSRSALHLYPIRLHQADARKAVFDGMRKADIGVNVHYIPVHTQPWYRRFGFRDGDFPQAEHYYAGAISLPMFPTLEATDQQKVVATLRGMLQ